MVTFEQLRNVKACLQKNDLLKHANLHNFMSLYHFGQQILLHSYSSQDDKQSFQRQPFQRWWEFHTQVVVWLDSHNSY